MPTPRFIVCRASAGSGKTYTLVRQFIEIAISTPSQLEERFSQILAITFTNKAANGMKERIMNTLADIVAGDEDDLVAEMAGHLLITPDEVLQRCNVVRSAILHHYSDLSVCTIDSFVHRLVRTFAHDLGLPMNFNIQIDEEDILKNSVENLLAQTGLDEELTSVLCEWVQDRMEDGHGYNVERDIKELSKVILSEEAPKYLEKLSQVPMRHFPEIFRQLREENRKIVALFKAAAQKALDARDRVGLTSEAFSNGKKYFNLFTLYAHGDMSNLNKEHKLQDGALERGSLYTTNCPQATRSLIEEATPDIFGAYNEITDLEERYKTIYNTRVMLMSNIYSMAVLGKVHEQQVNYSAENEIVHISEFNKRVAKVVADEPTPFIYERIGTRYHNYLIDEFQDTSRLQWLNMLPLLDEAMTYDFKDTADAGMCSLVVGDGKQAIYRFRQGDVRQFMMLPEVESDLHGSSLKRNYVDAPLSCNYRTLDEVVEFNNHFFEWAVTNQVKLHGPDADLVPQLYMGKALTDPEKEPDLYQSTPAGNKGGYVQLGFYDKEVLNDVVRDIIRHQVDDMGYRYRDIYVLAARKNTLEALSIFLNQPDDEGRTIPMVSSESFILSGSRVVLLVRSLLAVLHDSTDRAAAVMALRLYAEIKNFPSHEAEELLWDLRDSGFNMSKCLAKRHIVFVPEQLRALSLYDCVEHLLRIFDLNGYDSGFVATLLGITAKFGQNQQHGIGDLVKYLDDKMSKLSSSTSSDMDAVQLYTVHKAKGLEAPVVIFLVPQDSVRPTDLWLDIDGKLSQELSMDLSVAMVKITISEEMNKTAFDDSLRGEYNMSYLDHINQLYVALTRPKEKLFVVCTPGKQMDTALMEAFVKNGGYNPLHAITDGVYACGVDSHHEDKKKKARHRRQLVPKSVKLDNVSFPTWVGRIDIAKQSENVLEPMHLDHRRYGIMVHDILSHIVTISDAERELQRYSMSHHLSAEDIDAVRQRMMAMLESEQYKPFFDGSHRVSCEMSMMIDGRIRRPDRVVFADDATWVIDFKTGADDGASHASHLQQVQRYADALTLLGYPHVQPVLIYL